MNVGQTNGLNVSLSVYDQMAKAATAFKVSGETSYIRGRNPSGVEDKKGGIDLVYLGAGSKLKPTKETMAGNVAMRKDLLSKIRYDLEKSDVADNEVNAFLERAKKQLGCDKAGALENAEKKLNGGGKKVGVGSVGENVKGETVKQLLDDLKQMELEQLKDVYRDDVDMEMLTDSQLKSLAEVLGFKDKSELRTRKFTFDQIGETKDGFRVFEASVPVDEASNPKAKAKTKTVRMMMLEDGTFGFRFKSDLQGLPKQGEVPTKPSDLQKQPKQVNVPTKPKKETIRLNQDMLLGAKGKLKKVKGINLVGNGNLPQVGDPFGITGDKPMKQSLYSNCCWFFSMVNALKSTPEGRAYLNRLIKENGNVVTFYDKDDKPREYRLDDENSEWSRYYETQQTDRKNDTPLEKCAMWHALGTMNTKDWQPGMFGDMDGVCKMLGLVYIPHTFTFPEAQDNKPIDNGVFAKKFYDVLQKHLAKGEVATFNQTNTHFITITGVTKGKDKGKDKYTLTGFDSVTGEAASWDLNELLSEWDDFIADPPPAYALMPEGARRQCKASALNFAQRPEVFNQQVAKVKSIVNKITKEQLSNKLEATKTWHENEAKKDPKESANQTLRAQRIGNLLPLTKEKLDGYRQEFLAKVTPKEMGSWYANGVDFDAPDEALAGVILDEFAKDVIFNDYHAHELANPPKPGANVQPPASGQSSKAKKVEKPVDLGKSTGKVNADNRRPVQNASAGAPQVKPSSALTPAQQQKVNDAAGTWEELKKLFPDQLSNAKKDSVGEIVSCASVANGKYALCTVKYQRNSPYKAFNNFTVLINRDGKLLDPLETDYGKVRAMLPGNGDAWIADIFSEEDLPAVAGFCEAVGPYMQDPVTKMLRPHLLLLLPQALKDIRQSGHEGPIDAQTLMNALNLKRFISAVNYAKYVNVKGLSDAEKTVRALMVMFVADCYAKLPKDLKNLPDDNPMLKMSLENIAKKESKFTKERFLELLMNPKIKDGHKDWNLRGYAKNLLNLHLVSYAQDLPLNFSLLNSKFGFIPPRESYLGGCVLHETKLLSGEPITDGDVSLAFDCGGAPRRYYGSEIRCKGEGMKPFKYTSTQSTPEQRDREKHAIDELRGKGFANSQIFALSKIPIDYMINHLAMLGVIDSQRSMGLDVTNMQIEIEPGANGDMLVTYNLKDQKSKRFGDNVKYTYGVAIHKDGSMECTKLEATGLQDGEEVSLVWNPSPKQMDVLLSPEYEFKNFKMAKDGKILCDRCPAGAAKGVLATSVAIWPDGTVASMEKGVMVTPAQCATESTFSTKKGINNLATVFGIKTKRPKLSQQGPHRISSDLEGYIESDWTLDGKPVGTILIAPDGTISDKNQKDGICQKLNKAKAKMDSKQIADALGISEEEASKLDVFCFEPFENGRLFLCRVSNAEGKTWNGIFGPSGKVVSKSDYDEAREAYIDNWRIFNTFETTKMFLDVMEPHDLTEWWNKQKQQK